MSQEVDGGLAPGSCMALPLLGAQVARHQRVDSMFAWDVVKNLLQPRL